MPTSDLSLALMSSIPFSRPETFLDLGPDPWAPPGSTRLRRFYTRPVRVHGAERRDEDADHTPLTKGTGSVPACRRRPRIGTAAEVHLMMAKR